MQELLRVADRFQAGGAVRALSGGVWVGADCGDGDPAAGVGARLRWSTCGQLPCDPGRLCAGGACRGCGVLAAAN